MRKDRRVLNIQLCPQINLIHSEQNKTYITNIVPCQGNIGTQKSSCIYKAKWGMKELIAGAVLQTASKCFLYNRTFFSFIESFLAKLEDLKAKT